MALGSIIVPLHVNCRASSANAAMLEKAMMSDVTMLVRDIDKAPYNLDSRPYATRTKVAGVLVLGRGRSDTN